MLCLQVRKLKWQRGHVDVPLAEAATESWTHKRTSEPFCQVANYPTQLFSPKGLRVLSLYLQFNLLTGLRNIAS